VSLICFEHAGSHAIRGVVKEKGKVRSTSGWVPQGAKAVLVLAECWLQEDPVHPPWRLPLVPHSVHRPAASQQPPRLDPPLTYVAPSPPLSVFGSLPNHFSLREHRYLCEGGQNDRIFFLTARHVALRTGGPTSLVPTFLSSAKKHTQTPSRQ
jgi:hypothetical protein